MHHHKKDKRGLNLPHSQHIEMPDFRHETIIIPSTSQPSWGSYFIFDCKEKGVMLHDLGIQWTVSPIAGYTNAGVYPHYNPACFWATRIELVINNSVIDTHYPIEQFIHTQLFNDDQKRRLINNAMGAYDSVAMRYALSSVTSTYYVDLNTLFKQTHLHLLHPKDDIQIRVYMDSLSNVINAGPLVGTPSSTIQANLLCRVSRMSAGHIQHKHRTLAAPHHHKFLERRFGTFSIPAPSAGSNATIVLTPFVGLVSYLFFIVRYSTVSTSSVVPNVGDGQFTYNAITNFSILDNSSTNIVGGQAVSSSYALQYLNKDWIKSSYTSETAYGIVNINAYVYMYSFTADPTLSHETGVGYNAHRFHGNEQLQIQFKDQAYSNAQIDVWCVCEAAIETHQTYTKKISL